MSSPNSSLAFRLAGVGCSSYCPKIDPTVPRPVSFLQLNFWLPSLKNAAKFSFFLLEIYFLQSPAFDVQVTFHGFWKRSPCLCPNKDSSPHTPNLFSTVFGSDGFAVKDFAEKDFAVCSVFLSAFSHGLPCTSTFVGRIQSGELADLDLSHILA